MNREELLQIAKPILFNTDMVQAILDGRKTATRRVIKLKYDNTHHEMETDKYGTRLIEIENDIEGETFGKREDGTKWRRIRGYIEPKAPYKKGDILYIRETWGNGYNEGTYIYKADDELAELPTFKKSNDLIYKPSIHMPKEAARIFLKVTNVRAERLQEITQVDAIYEGALKYDKCETKEYKKAVMIAKERGEEPPLGYTPIERFAALWDSICKKSIQVHGWEANPWVWVIEFERLDVR